MKDYIFSNDFSRNLDAMIPLTVMVRLSAAAISFTIY